MTSDNTDYPTGDGHPKCPRCRGRGVIPVPQKERKPWMAGEITQQCLCTLRRDQIDNLRRAWRPAMSAPKLDSTPLLQNSNRNLRIRADLQPLKRHIRTLAMRQRPHWMFKVITDIDLMTSWLYSANEVFDGDVGHARLRGENMSTRITDLVEPWELLIIRLGVKAARNNATPEVLHEALLHREQLDLPTWVVDDPQRPFQDGHLAWSAEVAALVSDWEFLELTGEGVAVSTPAQQPVRGRVRRPLIQAQHIPMVAVPRSTPPPPEEVEEEKEDDFFSSVVTSNASPAPTSAGDDFFDRMTESDPDGLKKEQRKRQKRQGWGKGKRS